MADSSPSRRYFTVRDEAGRELPVVEYWAATLDDDVNVFHVVPLRRYVKVLGTGAYLSPGRDGSFIELQTGRRFRSVEQGPTACDCSDDTA